MLLSIDSLFLSYIIFTIILLFFFILIAILSFNSLKPKRGRPRKNSIKSKNKKRKYIKKNSREYLYLQKRKIFKERFNKFLDEFSLFLGKNYKNHY
jgi:hypothetical protein